MDKHFSEICEFLAKTDDAKTIARFLESLLTPKEVKTLSSRWQIVKLLDQGVPQRKIAKDLHLSLCKITRGSKELKKRNSILKKAISQYQTDG
ncbi:Trp family transcriptional regulator [Caldithrix abyssi]|uniref:Trp repressor n=1 Tax=Caldithrix abyssi DSM 13497 TaxID=880073 RepID=H1XX34_CALAY|nr:Trp family transcriptional regulator [Caldithrix abyssi]APF20730.1 TrpR family transcriptional regulator, trp operon repressor [Caldithrix abyssi DSM 13497]EHO40771.1 Trp repressor [Caldithrix abyssi DSM 13497]